MPRRRFALLRAEGTLAPMARLGLGLAAAVALALAGLAAWLFVLRDTAEPASVEGAVATFREGSAAGRDVGAAAVPAGVYVYLTRGFERTDALTGVTHRYPRRSTITVEAAPCGVQMRWDVLRGRSTTWELCVAGERWELRAQDERHTFFGRTERTTYACAVPAFRLPGDEAGRTLPLRCSAGGATEHGALAVIGPETIPVGGSPVAALHLRRRGVLEGRTRGTVRHDLWLDRASGVPLRLVMRVRTRNDSPIGPVSYEEWAALRLTSLEPRR